MKHMDIKTKQTLHPRNFYGKLYSPFFSQLYRLAVEDHILQGTRSLKERKKTKKE